MKPFEVLNHTADIGLKAYGNSLKQVFENAALGMFSLMTDMTRVSSKKSIDIQVQAEDREGLLAEWLNELIFQFEVKEILLKRFELIDWDKETYLRAKVHGEKLNPAKHELREQIKACTYHLLQITKNDFWTAQVLFDV